MGVPLARIVSGYFAGCSGCSSPQDDGPMFSTGPSHWACSRSRRRCCVWGAARLVVLSPFAPIYLLEQSSTCGFGIGHVLPPRTVADGSALFAIVACARPPWSFSTRIEECGSRHEGIPEVSRFCRRTCAFVAPFSITDSWSWSVERWSAARCRRTRTRPEAARLGGPVDRAGHHCCRDSSEIARIATGSVKDLVFAAGLFIGVSVMFAGFLKTRPRNGAP